MALPVAVRRQGYRIAHRLLRVWWLLRRPALHGVKCLLTDGDRVLLVRHTYGRDEWDLPGGTQRRSEPPEEAARREMREELGIDIPQWNALGDVLRLSYGCKDTLHCYHAEVSAPQLDLNAAELCRAHWFRDQELPADMGRHVHAIVRLAAPLRQVRARITPT